MKILIFSAALALAGALQTGLARSQPAQTTLTPLPPPRPFDLDLLTRGPMPAIVIPPPPLATAPPPAPSAPPPDATSPATSEPDEDEGPEWPRLTPGQKAGAEPAFDPNEKPERPGVSTDPGTSIACLPNALRQAMARVADRFGAVKVTSTWRPAWRARRGSYHKRCEAVDFRVPGVRPRLVLDFARALPGVGGNKVYWNGILHIDTGPRRLW